MVDSTAQGHEGLLLGIDAGQSVTKAALYDAEGHELAVARTETRISSPRPGWQERDLHEVWADTARVTRQVVGTVDPQAIRAVGVVGHSDGAYLINADGRPTRAGILATDARAADYVNRLGPDASRFLELTGQVPFAGSPAAVLQWLRDAEPESYQRFRWLLCSKDWLRFCLTGVVATDRTDAAASFLDMYEQTWSAEAFRLSGLGADLGRMPPILESGMVVGEVTAGAAQLTGLVAGTPVVTGAHDVDAAAVGIGAIDVGRMSVVMGTFSINQIVAEQPSTDPRWQARSWVEPGRWLHMCTSPSGAANLAWATRLLGRSDEAGQADIVDALRKAQAAASAADPPPTYLPFLFGGPFSPPLGGTFAGLSDRHSRGDLLHAVARGVVHSHRWHVDALRERFNVDRPIRVGGGGARSSFWTQLLSDGLRLPVEVTDAEEAGARGAAMLAGLGGGVYTNLDEAVQRAVRVVRRHDPDPASAARAETGYRAYLDLIQRMV